MDCRWQRVHGSLDRRPGRLIFLMVASSLRGGRCAEDGLLRLQAGQGRCDTRRHDGADGARGDCDETTEHGD